MNIAQSLLAYLVVSALVVGCGSLPRIEVPPYEMLKPPPGKAAIYFLADTHREKSNFGCGDPTSKVLSLSVNNLIAAKLSFGTYTVLYVEPVDIKLMASFRPAPVENHGDRCLYFLGSWGESKLIRNFRPSHDEVYFFEHERPNEWLEVGGSRAMYLIDWSGQRCEENCPDERMRPLYYSEPDSHYIDQIFDRMQCLDRCWQEKKDLPWEKKKKVCVAQCAEFFDE